MTEAIEVAPPREGPLDPDADTRFIEKARIIYKNLHLEARLRLTASGVPFDVAMALEGPELYAWNVACGEIQGGVFDWASGSWVDHELDRAR